MARRRYVARTETEEEDVNMTPLLDIVFIMLIFFIVTSTFIKEPGVEIQRPGTVTQEEQNPGILVGISGQDEVYIDGKIVDLDEVTFRVKELRRETPKGNVVLQADVDAKSQTMVDVLNRIKDAGIDNVAVSTEPS